MTREEQINDYMKKLEISREEAEQLLEDDENDFIGEDGEKMEENAKSIKRYEKSNKRQKAKPRERKVDNEKLEILKIIARCLETETDFDVEIEKEIAIHFGEYTLKLTRHRPPKK